MRNEISEQVDQPVNNVSWEQAMQYCEWLSKLKDVVQRFPHVLEKLPDKQKLYWSSNLNDLTLKLPSEIEWEYAAKAGHEFEYAAINGQIRRGLCNYNNFEEKTTPKGSFLPNPFEVYDMSGNLWEWCEDADDALKDYHVVRGGSCIDPSENCRTTSRHSFHRRHGNLFTGFRVMRVLS
jgi:formylglycine-generating enzyme required for sulfatase activity